MQEFLLNIMLNYYSVRGSGIDEKS